MCVCVLVARGGVPPRVSGGNGADGGQSWPAHIPLYVCPLFPRTIYRQQAGEKHRSRQKCVITHSLVGNVKIPGGLPVSLHPYVNLGPCLTSLSSFVSRLLLNPA